jgi:hypothetical protein
VLYATLLKDALVRAWRFTKPLARVSQASSSIDCESQRVTIAIKRRITELFACERKITLIDYRTRNFPGDSVNRRHQDRSYCGNPPT